MWPFSIESCSYEFARAARLWCRADNDSCNEQFWLEVSEGIWVRAITGYALRSCTLEYDVGCCRAQRLSVEVCELAQCGNVVIASLIGFQFVRVTLVAFTWCFSVFTVCDLEQSMSVADIFLVFFETEGKDAVVDAQVPFQTLPFFAVSLQMMVFSVAAFGF